MAIGALIRFDNAANSHALHPNEGSPTLSGTGHAARGLLSWTQAQLAKAASVGMGTVRRFEGERGTPWPATLTVLSAGP